MDMVVASLQLVPRLAVPGLSDKGILAMDGTLA